eukprot:m.3187 g.3187  ORF g.3187 m.3187 type:complete len:834 (-) comp2027_c0_seq2:316-2817(-)
MSSEGTDKGTPSIRVHTKGIRDVLSPISDQVAELILVDERAKSNGTGIPDLTQAAESIGSAIQSLVGVGKAAMQTGDEILKARMPAACEQIEAAGKLFLDASVELKADPFAEEARSLLITATRGLLTGTTNILMTYDTFEVRKIVVLGEGMIELLATAKAVTSLEELVVLIKSLSATLVSFVQLVEARQAELINDSTRQVLIRENEALRKASPLLVTALRTYIFNQDNDQALVSRDYAVEQALSSIHNIVVAVSDFGSLDDISTQDEFTFAKTKDALESMIFTGTVSSNGSEQLQALSQMSRVMCARGNRSKNVEGAVVNFEQAFEVFSQNPRQEVVCDGAMQALHQLDQAVKTSITHDVAATVVVEKEDRASSQFVTSVQQGITTSANEEAFSSEIRNLVKTASNVASLSLDGRRANLLQNTAHQIDACANQIMSTAQIIESNPSDESASQHLALLKDNYDHQSELLQSLVTSMMDAPRMVAVTGEHTQSSLSDAQNAAEKGDAGGVDRATKNIAKNVNLLTSLAVTEVENSDDLTYSTPIVEAVETLKEIIPRVEASLKAQSNDSSNTDLAINAAKSAKELKVGILQLQRAVLGESSADDNSATQHDVDNPDLAAVTSTFEQLQVDKVTVDVSETDADTSMVISAPSLLEGSNQPQGPIADAARNLKKETDKWSTKDNPIVQSAKVMAEEMASMAHVSQSTQSEQSGTRSELISTAKSIAERAKGIRKLALEAAESCSDKRLRADLLFLCDRLPTIATQLKIISSVRAAATHHSEDTDHMLINNAQNLMDAVQRIVRACEAASIKSFNQTANAVIAAIKWKRKIRASTSRI